MTQYPIAEVRERLKALLEKAKPGPWVCDETDTAPAARVRQSAEGEPLACFFAVRDDARLIAEAVTALPALLTHLDAVEGENARLKGDVERLKEVCTAQEETIHTNDDLAGRLCSAESQLASQAASLAEMREALQGCMAALAEVGDGGCGLNCSMEGGYDFSAEIQAATQALQNKAES
jgi:hypothetical protein